MDVTRKTESGVGRWRKRVWKKIVNNFIVSYSRRTGKRSTEQMSDQKSDDAGTVRHFV